MALEIYVFQPLSSNSGRVYMTLLEKGVTFVGHELWGPTFDHLKPDYLAINPRGQVPALVHDGLVLTEGVTINEYIDDAFEGPPLRPSDPRRRWEMRAWCRFAENDLGRALMMINWNRIVPSLLGDRSVEEIEKTLEAVPDPDRRRAWLAALHQTTHPEQLRESHRRVREGAAEVEARLLRHRWIAGPEHSLADIDMLNFCGFMADWMPDLVNPQSTPAFTDWMARMEERPAVMEMRRRTKPYVPEPRNPALNRSGAGHA